MIKVASIDVRDLRTKKIRPVLVELEMWSKQAEDLLVGTCCAESLCGTYRRQIKGPARGIFQMEPNTARDIVDNYLKYRKSIKGSVYKYYDGTKSLEDNLETNDEFAVAMCRVHYRRVPKKLPYDREGLAKYWKDYYNTSEGKGTVQGFLDKWNEFEPAI